MTTQTLTPTCPKCEVGEVRPRCRVCDDCAAGRTPRRPVLRAVRTDADLDDTHFEVERQMLELREALDLGVVDKREAARLGSLILVGAMPDVDWLGRVDGAR